MAKAPPFLAVRRYDSPLNTQLYALCGLMVANPKLFGTEKRKFQAAQDKDAVVRTCAGEQIRALSVGKAMKMIKMFPAYYKNHPNAIDWTVPAELSSDKTDADGFVIEAASKAASDVGGGGTYSVAGTVEGDREASVYDPVGSVAGSIAEPAAAVRKERGSRPKDATWLSDDGNLNENTTKKCAALAAPPHLKLHPKGCAALACGTTLAVLVSPSGAWQPN